MHTIELALAIMQQQEHIVTQLHLSRQLRGQFTHSLLLHGLRTLDRLLDMLLL